MKAVSQWSYDWYRPAVHGEDTIYICRVVPKEHSIALYWRFHSAPACIAMIREKGSDAEWRKTRSDSGEAVFSGLESDVDYEFRVMCGEEYSAVGYARTGSAPGIIVNYLHPADPKYSFSGQHLCTPSLLRHPDGYLLASMDFFAANAPQNLTLIFRSDDDGENWYHYTELFPCFWGKLFMHRGEVYMLSTSTEYGDVLIGKSSDGGKTFGTPTVLFRGSCNNRCAGWHKSAMPVIAHRGRLWSGVEYGAHACGGHATCVLSADENADLLKPDSWVASEPLVFNQNWPGAAVGDTRGFIEGSTVVLPDGEIGEVLRYLMDRGVPDHGLIPVLRGDSSHPERTFRPDYFASFPGNNSKFDVLRDPQTGNYYTIFNRIFDPARVHARTVLSLGVSEDLCTWTVLKDLLDYSAEDPRCVGLQYVSFLFDGDDILYLTRTAVNGARNFHDNNYSTFHRIPNFRRISPQK